MPKPLTVWITTNCGKFLNRWEYQTALPASWEICMQVKKQHAQLDMELQTGFKSGKKYVKAVYCYPAYLTYMQNAAAAKSLHSCLNLCNPIDGSPPGSAFPGILQQEHWSGLPFPSPMHESEKWNLTHSVVSDSLRLHGLQPTSLLFLWDFPGKSTGVSCHCLLRICRIHYAKCRAGLIRSWN